MSSPQFYATNVLSALVWAPAHVFPGVLIALIASVSDRSASHLVLVVIVGLILVSAAWALLRWCLPGSFAARYAAITNAFCIAD
jgi:membrane protein DedA with SNARE-associated domain